MTRHGPAAARALTTTLVLSLAACGDSSISAEQSPTPGAPVAAPVRNAFVAFVGVDVVPMDSDVLLMDRTVVVRDRRIETVGLRSDVVVPDGAEPIDASGLVLMPGLADMHVHMTEADLPTYIANGITTVRNMWGHDAIRDMRGRIEAGTLGGPTIYSTSPGIDGPPAKWPHTQIVESPAEAQQTVDRLVGDGWAILKVYQDLRHEVYDAVAAAARQHGVPFVGHVPHRVGLTNALLTGQASLEHLGGYDVALGGARGAAGWLNMDPAKIADVVTATREAGAYVCPTMFVVKELTRRNQSAAVLDVVVANRRMLLGALHADSVPILLGTDSGIDIVAPGTSLGEELLELTRSGLSPHAALAAGTIVAAAFLGQQDEFGAVREGLRADLLLLERNPLVDVSAAFDPIGVMLNGDWYSGNALADLANQH